MKNQRKGLTLIEVMVAAVVVVFAVLGAMAFRYVTALDARKADIQISAARVGLLLLEGWKAEKGRTTYNPVTEFNYATGKGLIFVDDGSGGPTKPDSFFLLFNTYEIRDSGSGSNNNLFFYTTLSYKDTTGYPRIRVLNARVGWLNGAAQGNGNGVTQYITLSNYVNID